MQLKINNTNLNVFESGIRENNLNALPTLVFLHYFGGSRRAWTEVIANLETNFYCVAPDLRGFGASADSTENHAVKDYADDVEKLTDILHLENYSIIGHSMGGKIALEFAARQPRGLKSLILLAPSPPTPEPINAIERKRLIETYGDRQSAAETVCKITAKPLPQVIFERAVFDNLQTSPTAWQAWLKNGSRENIAASLSKITVPVLVAAGEKDENMTADLLNREIVQRLKNASLVIIPAVKHLLPLEAPVAIADLIKQSLGISTLGLPI